MKYINMAFDAKIEEFENIFREIEVGARDCTQFIINEWIESQDYKSSRKLISKLIKSLVEYPELQQEVYLELGKYIPEMQGRVRQ